jgi:hypothetical protein
MLLMQQISQTSREIAQAISSAGGRGYLIEEELGHDSLNEFWRETGESPHASPDAYAESVLSILDEIIIPVILPEIERRAEEELENWVEDGCEAKSDPSEIIDYYGRPASYTGLGSMLKTVDREHVRAAAHAEAVASPGEQFSATA